MTTFTIDPENNIYRIEWNFLAFPNLAGGPAEIGGDTLGLSLLTTKLSASLQEKSIAPAELPKNQLLIVLTGGRQKLALDSSRCVQILREAGHMDTTTLSSVVDLGYIPDGLTAAE